MVGKSQSTAVCVMGTRTEDCDIPEYHLSAGIYNGLLWHSLDPIYPSELEPLLLKQDLSQKVRWSLGAMPKYQLIYLNPLFAWFTFPKNN